MNSLPTVIALVLFTLILAVDTLCGFRSTFVSTDLLAAKSIRAEITEPQGEGVFRVAVARGESVRIDVRRLDEGEGIQPFVRVFDPRGRLLQVGVGREDCQIRFLAPVAGLYRIVVADQDRPGQIGRNTGTYELQVRRDTGQKDAL